MRSPNFWQQNGVYSKVLAPISQLYALTGHFSHFRRIPWQASIPVVCIGNVVVGGAGKTPLALSIGTRLIARGCAVHFLSRGYGGRLKGPVCVDKDRHNARDVGDEPLLLADVAPTWISGNRAATAKKAIDAGADVLVMDDGMQNSTLAKTNTFLVIDGEYGFGNEKVFPAGPLRETVNEALKRTDEVVIIGEDESDLEVRLQRHVTVLKASFIVPMEDARALNGHRIVAFSGIARPGKFLRTLTQIGCEIVKTYEFTDHHVFKIDEVMQIVETASKLNATPVTTTKDAKRLPLLARPMVTVLPIEVAWQDESALDRILDRALVV